MSQKAIPYSALFIDITAPEYVKLFSRFLKTYDREELQKRLEDIFIKNSEKEHLMASLSVRTSLDLFLQATSFPKGSEILMTAINIPDMSSIIQNHGYVAVPVNVDVEKLSPKIEDIEKAITNKTKAILLSYIFGATFPIDEIISLCKKHNLYIIEDLAEAFRSTDINGHPEAHMSLFSFGSIKYNTAMSGALSIIRDENLYQKMKAIQEGYPIQPTRTYLKKCLKMIVVTLATNSPTANYVIKTVTKPFNFDYKEKFISLLRGFSKDGNFFQKFRFQVCTPLLANLVARMTTYNNKEFQHSLQKMKKAQDFLVDHDVKVPGYKVEDRNFWLFPIVVPDQQLCYKMLNERGVDAYLGATQLKVVEGQNVEETKEFFYKLLYLPIHKRVPEKDIDEICKIAIDVVDTVKKMN